MGAPKSPSSTFAGLISPAAENLYNRLRVARFLRSDLFHSQADAAHELVAAGLVFGTGENDEVIRPVEPAAALRLLLENEHRRFAAAHSRMLDGWDQLTTLLPTLIERGSGGGVGGVGGVDGVRLLSTVDDIVTKAAELYPSAKRRLRGTETGQVPTRPSHRHRTPPAAAIEAGVEFQVIYQSDYLDTQAGATLVAQSARCGEQVRLRKNVPVKMLHVDESVALVVVDRTTPAALLVRCPAVLAMLADWFDLMWTEQTTAHFLTPAANPVLPELTRRILTMMPFDDDASIARKLKVSVSTIRRHIKTIYGTLGTDNRFAAGVAAAKLGWV